MKTGITGATGQLGRLVVKKLKENMKTDELVALVRSPEKASDFGIEVRPFDYTKTDTLEKGFQGIDQLLLISSNEVGQRKAHHQNVIKAAQKAGVQHIVYTSLLHADTTTISLADEHKATEELIKASGIPYTILRNGWYTENYTASIPSALENGTFIGSAGEGKISSASREDFAEAAVAVLTGEGHVGKIYELAGDEAYTLQDLAAEISRQTGKNIPYNNLPEADYANTLTSAGVPEDYAKEIARWDIGASQDDLFNEGKVLSRLIGRPTTPMADTVRNTLGQ